MVIISYYCIRIQTKQKVSDFVVSLQVLDLNEMAFTWSLAQYGKGAPRPKGIYEVHEWALAYLECLRYRSRGFVLTGVVWEYLGPQDNAHLVAYQASDAVF